jgi:hypothetical protein
MENHEVFQKSTMKLIFFAARWGCKMGLKRASDTLSGLLISQIRDDLTIIK